MMKRLPRYGYALAAGVLALLLATPACAGMAEDISAPTLQELRFSSKSIALVFPHGVFKIDRSPGLSEPIDQQMLEAQFAASEVIRPSDSRDIPGYQNGVRWALPDGSALDTQPGYCNEGANISLEASRSGTPLETYLGNCEALSAVALVKGQLWLGSVEHGEFLVGPGSGVRVVSLRDGELIEQFLPKDDLADGLVRLIQADPFSDDVWIATQTALHRVHKLKVVERWYGSEQFSSTGKWSYELSKKRKKSADWAIWARATGLANETFVGKQLQRQPKLRQRLRYNYDEEGQFFSVDGIHLSIHSDAKPSWPSGFDWLKHALMNTLRQAKPSDGEAQRGANYTALVQLCFFKDPSVASFLRSWQRTQSEDQKLDWVMKNMCLPAQGK